jgi:hypothetical protein
LIWWHLSNRNRSFTDKLEELRHGNPQKKAGKYCLP